MSLTPLIRRYGQFPPLLRALISGGFLVLPVLISAFITFYLRLSLERTIQVQLFIAVVAFVLYAISKRYVELRVESMDQATQKQRDALGQAYALLDDVTARRTTELEAFLSHDVQLSKAADVFRSSIAGLQHIQILIEALYTVFESQFGQTGALLAAIDFEVTFMSMSYRDGKITIYAWQNRDRRAPRSLVLRNTDPDLYSTTVTAQVYKDVRPEMRITEDTGKESYAEVYPGQRDRIKSAVVYPVLSPSNKLLGTTVVHCNKPGFFKNAEAAFWRKLLEIYAKRIAHEKIALDSFGQQHTFEWLAAVKPDDLKPDW